MSFRNKNIGSNLCIEIHKSIKKFHRHFFLFIGINELNFSGEEAKGPLRAAQGPVREGREAAGDLGQVHGTGEESQGPRQVDECKGQQSLGGGEGEKQGIGWFVMLFTLFI